MCLTLVGSLKLPVAIIDHQLAHDYEHSITQSFITKEGISLKSYIKIIFFVFLLWSCDCEGGKTFWTTTIIAITSSGKGMITIIIAMQIFVMVNDA